MKTIKQIWDEARQTLTAWLAAAFVTVAAIDNQIDNLYALVPTLQPYLPVNTTTSNILHLVMTVLGVGVAVARVRRTIWPPKAP